MYCQKCGAQNDDSAAVCGKCGTNLREATLGRSTPATAEPPAVQYAGFWRRLGASIIDQLILQILGALFLGLFFAVGAIMPESWVETAIVFILLTVLVVVSLLYWPLMESSQHQATLGKQALGIMVTDVDGKRISFARAVGRNLGKLVSAIIYYVGFFMIAFTKKKQGLHDMMANCVVVKKE
jgi:uncharacterized RDD family membrane protein YckC